MTNKIGYDFSSLEGIFQRPQQLNDFALERVEKMRYLLDKREEYNCPPSCKMCCYGSILMSYTEYNYIMLYLAENWDWDRIRDLFAKRVGLLQDNEERMLLCPFLQEGAAKEHCSIYAARPLICRVFGTTAAPCQELIKPSGMEEALFYNAYDLLYYGGNNNFIALNLDQNWAVYEAPFAFWCLADNSDETRKYLRVFIEEQRHSFHAVLYDNEQRHFFVMREGKKEVLSR